MVDWLQGKSAKMWVNEICVKQLRQPQWDTRAAHPGQQPPTFICQCRIVYSDKILEAQGTGKTKKDAEQEAALEMLKNKLEMTPAKLLALIGLSKRKSGGVSNSSSINVSSANSGDDTEEGITDTDDNESVESENKSGFNPISELAAILDQNTLEDPVYEEVNTEGPPHKRIFTVSCTVQPLSITFSGRRYTKKVAKRLAAFRVLREVKRRGFQYVSHNGDEENGTTDDSVNREDAMAKAAQLVHERDLSPSEMLAKLSLSNTTETRNSVLDKHYTGQQRSYCDDKSEKCLEHCKDYLHAFHHLKQSETLDKYLASSDTESFVEFGGAESLLQQIFKEIGAKLCFIEYQNEIEIVTFVKMSFPFNFKFKVPKTAAVFGSGNTTASSRSNAAGKAVKMMRDFCTSRGD